MFYYLKYIGLGIFKRIINITKRSGLIHDANFHMYHINHSISVSSMPTKDNFDTISAFDVVIGFIEPNEYRSQEIEWINHIHKIRSDQIYSYPKHKNIKNAPNSDRFAKHSLL